MPNYNKRFIYTSLLLIFVILIYLFVPSINEAYKYQLTILTNNVPGEVTEYINGFGKYKIFISLYFMALQAVVADIVALNIMFANEEIYGWFLGSFVSWFGSMIGTSISFLLARNILHMFVRRFLNKKYYKIMDMYLERFGGLTILAVKLSKFLYFDLITYIVAVSSMRFTSFIKAVALGQLIFMLQTSYQDVLVHRGVSLTTVATEYVAPLLIFGYIIFTIIKEKKDK